MTSQEHKAFQIIGRSTVCFKLVQAGSKKTSKTYITVPLLVETTNVCGHPSQRTSDKESMFSKYLLIKEAPQESKRLGMTFCIVATTLVIYDIYFKA